MLEWADYLKHVNRFSVTEEQWHFLSTALDFIIQTPHEMPSSQLLFRARKHAAQQERTFPLKDMGSPPLSAQKSGRCTPAGIPCLYLASDPETAIAETRPWQEALLSVATFSLKRSIRLADVRNVGQRLYNGSGLGDRKRDKQAALAKLAYLAVLTHSFSRPAHEETEVDYAPTQFIAGVLKANGFDGMLYSSLLKAMGLNIALFNPSLAIAKQVEVYRVTEVHYWAQKRLPLRSPLKRSRPSART